ncbi:MAG: hypothetical protein ACP5HQ_05355 [Thermoprotei archaeon]
MSKRPTRFTTNIIFDLDQVTCSSDPAETIGFAEKGTIFKVRKDSPFLEILRVRKDVKFLSSEGDTLYFLKQ